MERHKYNKLILETLSKLVDEHPYLRFGQILVDCRINKYEKEVLCDGQRENLLTVDPFNEESEVTWDRMLKVRF